MTKNGTLKSARQGGTINGARPEFDGRVGRMKRYIFFLISLLLFVTIQIVLLRHLAIRDVTPDLILIGVVYFSLKHDPALGIPIGFFLGCFRTSLLLGSLGLTV